MTMDGGAHSDAAITNPANPAARVTITATWNGVRHWLNAANLFEQGKLFAQVMTGFELLALKKACGVMPGNNQHTARFSQIGKSSSAGSSAANDWEIILQQEAGMGQSTAYRYMEMARAAAPRLKKLPALNSFDPFTQPMSQLPAPQREAMETAVRKLTDGKTQTDFFEDLYKTGGRGPGREPGCDNGRTKLSLSEAAALRRTQADADWRALARMLAAYRDKFVLLADDDIIAQTAALEQALNPRKAWLKQPLNQRQPRAIEEFFAK